MSFDTELLSKEDDVTTGLCVEDYIPSGDVWYMLKNGTWIDDFEADRIVKDLMKKTSRTRIECIEIFAKRLKGFED